MPIKIPDDLPARRILREEGVLVIDEHTALHQDIRPLQVALLYQLCDLEHRRGVITVADFRKLLPRPSFDVYPPVSMATNTTDSSGQVELNASTYCVTQEGA